MHYDNAKAYALDAQSLASPAGMIERANQESTFATAALARVNDKHKDEREQALQPGALKIQQSTYDQQEAAAARDRAAAAASKAKDVPDKAWKNTTITNPATGEQTTARVAPDGLTRQVLVPGVGYVNDVELENNKLDSMKAIAKDNGWVVAAGPNGEMGFRNPTQPGWEHLHGAFSTDPKYLKSNKQVEQKDNNGAGRIAGAFLHAARAATTGTGKAYSGGKPLDPNNPNGLKDVGNIPVGLVK
jgi:hypothetical protein